jgi:hypothetical protein
VLLLVTIALVLVAAVALVIGFVSNQLPPIYLSIVCSFVAAVVLALFSRLNRRRVAPAGAHGGPAPLLDETSARTYERSAPAGRAAPAYEDEDEDEVEEEYAPSRDTRVLTPVAEARAAAVPRPATPPPPRAPVPATPVPSSRFQEDDEEDEEDWDEEPIFPIEDYDLLRVAEILPLLRELDPDELEDVRDREEAGRSRATILNRIDQLLGQGQGFAEEVPISRRVPEAPPAASAAPSAAPRTPPAPRAPAGPPAAAATSDPAPAAPAASASSPAPAPRSAAARPAAAAPPAAPTPRSAPAPAPEPESEPAVASVGSASVFPIADYDELRVAQILPLLSQLDPDELEEVADWERQRANRRSVLSRIDRLLGSSSSQGSSSAAPARAAAASKSTAGKRAAARTSGVASAGAAAAAAAKETATRSPGTKKSPAKRAPARSTSKSAAPTTPAAPAAEEAASGPAGAVSLPRRPAPAPIDNPERPQE